MPLRTATLVLALLLVSLAACGAGAADDGSSRTNNARNPNPAATGIGPSGDMGAAPRDMPGGGRGSTTAHGK
jgi:hypothetical protein